MSGLGGVRKGGWNYETCCFGSSRWSCFSSLVRSRQLYRASSVDVIRPCVLATITNPTESSFRSHLTELSFRRHLADIRSSDDSSAPEDEPHVSTSLTFRPDHVTSIDAPPIAPFRFANHVAISLRTPKLLYKTFLLFSLAITSPLCPPPFLSDPAPALRGKHTTCSSPRDRVVLFFGFMGHWASMGQVPPRAEWVWRLAVGDGREKGMKKDAATACAGVLEMRALPGKEDPSNGGLHPSWRNSTLISNCSREECHHPSVIRFVQAHAEVGLDNQYVRQRYSTSSYTSRVAS